MRIVYIGCVKSSEVFLRSVLETGAEVVGVVTARESSFNTDFTDITPICVEHGIDYHLTIDVNDAETVSYIRYKKPDVIYCFGWSKLIKKEVLDVPQLGVIGFHPAALPLNRGRHPIIWALALGLTETASTFFKMDEGADTGDIISQEKVPISSEDDAASLYEKVLNIGSRQVRGLTEELISGTVRYVSQDVNEGNAWRKRGYADGRIDWRMSCEAIYNLVRALTHPYAGAHITYLGRDHKVWKVRPVYTDRFKNMEMGKVLYKEQGIIGVKAYDGVIEITDIDSIDISTGDYL